MSKSRVQWEDPMGSFVIADKTPSGWKFFEREWLAVRWYPLRATSELIRKADELLLGNSPDQNG